MEVKPTYDNLTEAQKKDVLHDLYHSKKLSWRKLAEELGITPDKARRQAQRLGVVSRDKQAAQRVALAVGRSIHRTAGRQRRPDEKLKISESCGKAWDKLTEEEYQYRRDIARKAWDEKTDLEKEEIRKRSSQSLNISSKYGSKLERFLLAELTKLGYKVDFHKTYMLRNTNLTIDLLLPSLSTAIEVDGPNHFEPIWGEDDLQQTILSDQRKTGLILSENMCLIRIKQDAKLTQRFMRNILASLLNVLKQIEKLFPPRDQRYFQI